MIGDTIAYFRKLNHYTQEQLGQLLGVTNQAVSKWESGVCLPDIMLIPSIADVLHISLDTLYGKSENRPVKVKADEFPEYCYVKLTEEFFNQSGARVDIEGTDESNVSNYFRALSTGWNLGCVSETAGSIMITKDIAFIDRSFKKNGIEDYLKSGTIASALQILGDGICRKVLSYQYQKAFSQTENPQIRFTLEDICENCNIQEQDAYEVLEKLASLNLEVKEIQDKALTEYCFIRSKAMYISVLLKIVELLVSDERWHVLRNKSIITDHAFEALWDK